MARRLALRIAVPLAALVGCLLAIGLLSLPAPARPAASPGAEADKPPPPFPPASGPTSPGVLGDLSLETLQAAFSRPSADPARTLARRLAQAAPADAEALHSWLHRRTSVSAEDYKSVLRAIGAAVPNRAGRFATGDNRPGGEQADVDWLERLLALSPARLVGPLRRARSEAALSVALMRGLASSRHPEAALSLLRFAYRHQGAFRDEAGRQIRAMGAHAVPGLLRAGTLKDPEAYRMVRYAAYQLDRIDCARPDRALKQADPELRVEILHAYGEMRTPAAVRAVLAYTNDPVLAVRRSARWATLRFLSGRPPKVVKRRLKLPGGKETGEERALYLTYRQLATHALLDRLAAELSGSGPGNKAFDATRQALSEETEPRYLAEKLFARFDQRRAEAHRAEVQAALKLGQRGALEEALRRFDRILAADPYHEQRAVMAPFYFRKGKALFENGSLHPAATYLTKAVHLAPEATFVVEARALRALAGALADRSMSAESEWKLRSALRLKPELRQAALALQAFEKRQQQRLWWASGIGGVIALSLILGLALLRRRVAW